MFTYRTCNGSSNGSNAQERLLMWPLPSVCLHARIRQRINRLWSHFYWRILQKIVPLTMKSLKIKAPLLFAVTIYCWPHVTAWQLQNGRVQNLTFPSSTTIYQYVLVLVKSHDSSGDFLWRPVSTSVDISNITRWIFVLAKNILYSVQLLHKSCDKVKAIVMPVVN
jgi:hypothetical protein